MPVLVAALLGGLLQFAGSLVGRVLLSLGFGYAVFKGVDVSITWARDLVIARISAVGGNFLAAASAMKVGVCISILTSAVVTRMTLNGLQGGSIRRLIQK